MANYLLTYTGGEGMPETEAEQAAVMEAWGAWYAQLGEAVVDGGAPLGERSTINPDGSVTDTPVSHLTGYTVIAADDLSGAVALAKGCPILGAGGTIEVNACLDMS